MPLNAFSVPWQQKEAINALNHRKYLEYERQMEVKTFSTFRRVNISQGSPRVCGKLWSPFPLLLEESRISISLPDLARSYH